MTALLLQAAYCDYQIGAFENLHQLVEDTLIVLRPGPKIFFQYELRFANCLKSQLLIGHRFLPIKQCKCSSKESARNQVNFWKYRRFFPAFLNGPINFCFNGEALRAQSRRPPVQHRFGRRPRQARWRLLNPALSISDLKDVPGPYQHAEKFSAIQNSATNAISRLGVE
jgi:hypothetical protein